ncbi:MAG: hypothetical protein IKA11_04535 [Clostridia bacterium]|nr:hypothetical protein [Clostridia bacterium]
MVTGKAKRLSLIILSLIMVVAVSVGVISIPNTAKADAGTAVSYFTNLSNPVYEKVAYSAEADAETAYALTTDLTEEATPIKYNRVVDVPQGGMVSIARIGGWHTYTLPYTALYVKVEDATDSSIYFETRMTRVWMSGDNVTPIGPYSVVSRNSENLYYGQEVTSTAGAVTKYSNIPYVLEDGMAAGQGPNSWHGIGKQTLNATALQYVEYLYSQADNSVYMIFEDSAYGVGEQVMKVANFNDTAQFANAWAGFTSGKVKISIFGSNKAGVATAVTTEKSKLFIETIGGMPACADWASDKTVSETAGMAYGATLSVTDLNDTYVVGATINPSATFTVGSVTKPAYIDVYTPFGFETGKTVLNEVGIYNLIFMADFNGNVYFETRDILVDNEFVTENDVISGAVNAETIQVDYQRLHFNYATSGEYTSWEKGSAVTLDLPAKTAPITLNTPVTVSGTEKTHIASFGFSGMAAEDKSIQRAEYSLVKVKVEDASDSTNYFETAFLHGHVGNDRALWWMPSTNSANVAEDASTAWGGQGCNGAYNTSMYNKDKNDFATTSFGWGALGNCTIDRETGAQPFFEMYYSASDNSVYLNYYVRAYNATAEDYILTPVTDFKIADFNDLTNQFSAEWAGFGADSQVKISIYGENTLNRPAGTADFTLEKLGGKDITLDSFEETYSTLQNPELDVIDGGGYAGQEADAKYFVNYANAYYNGQVYTPYNYSYEWVYDTDIVSTDAKYVPTEVGEYTVNITVTDYFGNTASASTTYETMANPIAMDGGAQIRVDDASKSGIMFTTYFDKQFVSDNALAVEEGYATAMDYGTFIIPLDMLEGLSAFSMENYELALGHAPVANQDYLDVAVSGFYEAGETETCYAIRATIKNIKAHNYTRQFVGIGYVKATLADGSVMYMFANLDKSLARSVYEVAKAAYEDRSAEWTDIYEYETANGDYSQLDDVQLGIAESYIDSVVILTVDGETATYAGGVEKGYSAPYTATVSGNVVTITSEVEVKTVLVNGVRYTEFTSTENDGKTVTVTIG